MTESQICMLKPPMVLEESGLISVQVSLMRPIYIEKCILVLKQVVLIMMMLTFSDVDSGC